MKATVRGELQDEYLNPFAALTDEPLPEFSCTTDSRDTEVWQPSSYVTQMAGT